VQEQRPQFEQLLKRRVVGFGGMYTDNAGTLVIAATPDSIEQARSAARQAPREAAVRVVEVRWTLAELLAVQTRISADKAALRRAGIDVHTLASDIPSNTVQIGVRNARPSAARHLAARYGPMVRIMTTGAPEAACVRSDCPNPLKAGLAIAVSLGCTSGFGARDGSNYFLMTAAHCGTLHTPMTHNSVEYGTIQRRSFADGGTVDASAARINATQKSNLVYRGAPSTFFNVIGKRVDFGPGDVVCLSGRSLTSYDCGHVVNNFVEACWEGRCFWDLTLVKNIEAVKGQSGGPMFTLPSNNNVYASGIMGAIADDPTLGRVLFYSKIDNVEVELGVSICRNASCT
jgi:hypothetical protein